VRNRPTYQSVLPDLADTWVATYKRALDDGYAHAPSGKWTKDPRCGAAAALASAPYRGIWPAVYGGTLLPPMRWRAHPQQPPEAKWKWSATRYATIETFERAIALGLNPGGAAWILSTARKLGRERLGISRGDPTTTEMWLRLSAEEKESHWQVGQTEFFRRKRADLETRIGWARTGMKYTATTDDLRRLVNHVSRFTRLLEELMAEEMRSGHTISG